MVEVKNNLPEADNLNNSYDAVLKNIDDLNHGNIDASKESKDYLNNTLTNEFLTSFVSGLTGDQKEILKSSVQETYNKLKNDPDFDKDQYSGLLLLASSLDVDLDWDNGGVDKPDSNVKLPFNWGLDDAVAWEEGKRATNYSQLKFKRPENDEEERKIDDELKLYKAVDDLNNQIVETGKLLKNEKLKDNPDLVKLDNTLSKLLAIINNPTPENVRLLQNFIFDNMDNQGAREDFKKNNTDKTNNNQFDGKLWKNTLKYLNEGLDKTRKYINDLMEKEGIKEKMEKPELWLNLNLVGVVVEWAEGNRATDYWKLKFNRPENDEEEKKIAEEDKLYLAVDDIKNQIDETWKLLENEKLKDNPDLKMLNEVLGKTLAIINNPTKGNIQILQNFIFQNLKEQDHKNEFKAKNKYNDKTKEFDWEIWRNTLKWLREGLKKTEKYINDLNEWVKQEDSDKGNWEWWDKDNDKLENNWPIDTTPMKIGEENYLVAENSESISKECHFSNAIFYSVNSIGAVVEPLSDGTYQRAPLETGWKREYYMQLTNNPDVYYKVELDESWNLCPIATAYNRNSTGKDWKPMESKILISSNESCKKYLYNKLPEEIKNSDIKIWWDNVWKDYTLKSHWKELTIEPLSIAGDRVSTDISKNLAFINLTNFLLDLKGKSKTTELDSKLWIKVNWNKINIVKEKFGLWNADGGELSRFKWYYNHEWWRDDWDNKKKNNIYTKVLIW